jgi:hypothetical protein
MPIIGGTHAPSYYDTARYVDYVVRKEADDVADLLNALRNRRSGHRAGHILQT